VYQKLKIKFGLLTRMNDVHNRLKKSSGPKHKLVTSETERCFSDWRAKQLLCRMHSA